MSDTVKKVSRIINAVVFLVICVAAVILYYKVKGSNSKTEDISRMQGYCSSGQWQAFLDEYEKMSVKYPEIKGQCQEQISTCYQGFAQEKYTKAISLPAAERVKGAGELCALFEKAAGIDKLSQVSVEEYCDALMDAGNFDKAGQVLKDAEARPDIDASKLLVYKTRLQRKK
ncbi:MAG TPA: hypothetical protein DET40_05465 [Lentisphaeria bacterium]|nr:MAG: hypothetical protein A2X45_03885 [Lentisphaerae bacterium GWF2_50_93]HCE42976.1 hypothetical protein [Lentisphaeria bacterium]